MILLVLVLPKEGKFRYEFTKGKPWLHDDLYAPFDFAIIKYEDELKTEQEEVLARPETISSRWIRAIYRSQKVHCLKLSSIKNGQKNMAVRMLSGNKKKVSCDKV